MNSTPTLRHPPEAIEKLRELTKGMRTAMITTQAEDGALHSRPMATQEIGGDGVLWFFTSDDSGKANEVARHHQVNVSYSEPDKDRYVSIAGVATVSHDRAKAAELWNTWVKAYFPGGLDDPHLALLRIEIDSAAYWDVKESKMVQLIKMARAAVTGRAPDLGEHGKIDLPLRYTARQSSVLE